MKSFTGILIRTNHTGIITHFHLCLQSTVLLLVRNAMSLLMLVVGLIMSDDGFPNRLLHDRGRDLGSIGGILAGIRRGGVSAQMLKTAYDRGLELATHC